MPVPLQLSTRIPVYAHRGSHPSQRPYENSLGAFSRAINLGADFAELDVHRTRDGVLVIHHDPKLVDGRLIADLGVAELPPLPDGQRIPRLAEVAQLARATNGKLAVEMKEKGYEQQVVDELLSVLPAERFEMISFNASSIERVEQLHPEIRTGLLAPHIFPWMRESPLMPAAVWLMDRLGWHPTLNTATKIGADYVSVDQRQATSSFIDDAHGRGTPVMAWTVDSARSMDSLLARGIDGLISNHAKLAMQRRDAAANHSVPQVA